MATVPWGRVTYRDIEAGTLRREADGRYVFAYALEYLQAGHPAIAVTLPLREEPYVSEGGLHAFFDNLMAEGWLRNAQARALGVGSDDRFALLLAFGRDCAGAVSIVDPQPAPEPEIDLDDSEILAALTARASLSGVQRKLFVVREASTYRIARRNEVSTHIAKLPSGSLPNIVDIEFLTTAATHALLPDDAIVETEIAPVESVSERALIVKRFDRVGRQRRKRHFEEFAQLLGKRADQKYDGAYHDMAAFIRKTSGCVPADAERLFARILACILVGNGDAHLKNFAMRHTPDGLRLAPAYDLVATALYPEYRTLALAVGDATDLEIGAVQPKHVIALGQAFGLPERAIVLAVDDLGARLAAAKDAAGEAQDVRDDLKASLIEMMDRGWNGTFASIGTLLSKRRGSAAKSRA